MNIVLERVISEKSLYTWNKNWIVSKYESPWGILQKFQWANQADEKDILEIFGTEKIKSKKYKQWSQGETNLITMAGFDSTALRIVLGQDIKTINYKNLNEIIGNINHHTDFIRDKVFYCPKCMENGHHSIFHQLSFLNKCAFHKIKLLDKCPKCGLPMFYKIYFKAQNSPNICSCGNFFEEKSKNNFLMKKWIEPLDLNINLSELKTFQELKDEHKSLINRVYFNTDLVNSHLDYFLYYMLSFVNKDYKLKNGMQHYMSILKYRVQNDCSKDNEVFRESFAADLYRSIKYSYNSVARRLRNMLFKNKSCITNLKLLNFMYDDIEEEICPLAFSYITWRQK